MFGSENGDMRPEMKLGTMRMLSVTRAVVDWTIPGPKPNADTIAALHPSVFEQLWDAISFGTSGPDPTPAEPRRAKRAPAAANSS